MFRQIDRANLAVCGPSSLASLGGGIKIRLYVLFRVETIKKYWEPVNKLLDDFSPETQISNKNWNKELFGGAGLRLFQ